MHARGVCALESSSYCIGDSCALLVVGRSTVDFEVLMKAHLNLKWLGYTCENKNMCEQTA